MNTATAERDTAKHGKRLTLQQVALISKLHTAGQTDVGIAEIVGCSRQAVDYTLAKMSDTRELAVQAIHAKALQSVEDWHRAARTAARKGDHRGSKELAEAALPELRPQVGGGNQAQVVVLLGTSGQPLSPPALVNEARAIANGPSPLSPATFAPVLEAKVLDIAKDSVLGQANKVR